MVFLGGHKAGETAWKSLSWEEAVPRDFFCHTEIQLLATPACAVWDPQEGLCSGQDHRVILGQSEMRELRPHSSRDLSWLP